MAVINASEYGSLKVFNPTAIYVTPFITNSEGNSVRGTDTYKLNEVIRDSTSITQDDPEETAIENEFGSAPIINNVTLGSYQFSAQVANMHQTLLNKLCGFKVGKNKTDRVYAPSTYVPIYAEIVLAFQVDADKVVAAVLPKVQLNSKATFESLSSSMGTITLAGTGQNIALNDTDAAGTPIESPFYIDTTWDVTTELV